MLHKTIKTFSRIFAKYVPSFSLVYFCRNIRIQMPNLAFFFVVGGVLFIYICICSAILH